MQELDRRRLFSTAAAEVLPSAVGKPFAPSKEMMRSLSKNLARMALATALVVPQCYSCELSPDEDAYLSSLLPGPPLTSTPVAVLPPRPPVDAHSVNLSAHQPVGGSTPPLTGLEAQYVSGVLKTTRTTPCVTRVATLRDVSTLGAETAVVGIARGCDPIVGEALLASMEAAAAQDTKGLTWYLVSNETPDAVVRALESRVRVEVPEVGDGDALPLLVVLDRMGARGCKYIMPPTLHNPPEEGSSSSSALLALSAVPFPSQIRAFTGDAVSGKLPPTLIGEESAAPLAGGAAAHPQFTIPVTSATWASVVLDTASDVVLEAYLTHCPMCLCLAPRVAMAAEVAAKWLPPGVDIKVGTMNVDDNERPLDWMPGDAFPTIQLFNRGGRSTPNHKLSGSGCTHLRTTTAGGKSSPGGAATTFPLLPRSTLKGTPPCVPSLDFTHPTTPGKMALPSVRELVAWLGGNCSTPFNPATLRVPAQAVAFSGRHAPWAEVFPGTYTGGAAEVAPGGAATLLLPLTALLEDMDAECRVFEAAVFDSMFASHVCELVSAAVATPPLGSRAEEEAEVLVAAKAHGAAQAAWVASGRDIRSYSPHGGGGGDANGGLTPRLGGLPGFATDAEWREVKLPALVARAAALRAVSTGAGVGYGGATSAWEAMGEVGAYSAEVGARGVARAWVLDQEDLRNVAASIPLALALIQGDKLA